MLPHNYQFEAIGTQWNIDSEILLSDSIKKEIQDRIETFDKTYSRFREDSLVTQMKERSGAFGFPPDVISLMGIYTKLYGLTKGRMTPLIGEALERAGYDAKYSFKSSKQLPVPRLNDALRIKDSTLETTQPLTLDVGAIGKGLLVDSVATILDKHAVKEYVIDASGDLMHKGKSKNRVGLEHPQEPGKVIGVVDVQNMSLCASASNRRMWGEVMHHIFDPDTNAPVREIIATWVIAHTTTIADGLATALFFADPNVLAQEFDYQYVRMHSDGTLDYSHNFDGELF